MAKINHVIYFSQSQLLLAKINKLNVHLFLQTATVIGLNKSRDLFQPITVAACQNN